MIIHSATLRDQTWKVHTFSIQLFPSWDTTDSQAWSQIPAMLSSNYLWTSLCATKIFLSWSCAQVKAYIFLYGNEALWSGSTSRETRLLSWRVKFGLHSLFNHKFKILYWNQGIFCSFLLEYLRKKTLSRPLSCTIFLNRTWKKNTGILPLWMFLLKHTWNDLIKGLLYSLPLHALSFNINKASPLRFNYCTVTTATPGKVY